MDDGRRHPRRQHLAVLARLHRHHVFVLRAADVALLQLTGCGTDSAATLKCSAYGTALINFHPSVKMLGWSILAGKSWTLCPPI